MPYIRLDHSATPWAYRSATRGSWVLSVFAALVKTALTKLFAPYPPAKGRTHTSLLAAAGCQCDSGSTVQPTSLLAHVFARERLTKQDLNHISDFNVCSWMDGCMGFVRCPRFVFSCLDHGEAPSEVPLHVGYLYLYFKTYLNQWKIWQTKSALWR